MKADATPRRGTRNNCVFQVQTSRGEAVVFGRQGHAQDAIVILVYENGRPALEKRIDFLTLFPDMIREALGHSMIKRGQDKGLVEYGTCDPRDFTTDKHRTVDDTPYGGGGGMLMRADVVIAAVEAVAQPGTPVILMSPQGRLFSHAIAKELVGDRP